MNFDGLIVIDYDIENSFWIVLKIMDLGFENWNRVYINKMLILI